MGSSTVAVVYHPGPRLTKLEQTLADDFARVEAAKEFFERKYGGPFYLQFLGAEVHQIPAWLAGTTKGLESVQVLRAVLPPMLDLDGDDVGASPPNEVHFASTRRSPVTERASRARVVEEAADLVEDQMLESTPFQSAGSG
jgi:hypothetical protein